MVLGFWIFMFLMDLLVPLTMIIFGNRFMKKAPEKINNTYGYRTKMSMKNKDTWDFAHKCIGRIWFYTGIAMIVISAVAMVFTLGKDIETVGVIGMIICFAQAAVMLMTIIPVEVLLNKTFDKRGRRK